jgi:hypothetical protein
MAATSREQNSAKWHRWYVKQLKEKDLLFNIWLAKLAKAPLRTLTEAEWIASCKHFGKCALCKTESIDARGLFIAYALGGRYTVWNVIPVCERCATALRFQQNPYIKYADVADEIVKYLEGRLPNETNI